MISLLIIFREKLLWRDIQTQFMRERSHSNMKFVPVAVTAVKWESKVRTGSWTTGSSPPRGVFTSSPQKSSPIWVNFVLIQPKDGDMKSSPRDPVPENKCRYFILEDPKQVLYPLQYIRLQYILKKKTKTPKRISCLWSFEKKLEKQTKNGYGVHKKGTQIFNSYKWSASNVKIPTRFYPKI